MSRAKAKKWHWVDVVVRGTSGRRIRRVRGYTAPHIKGLAVTRGVTCHSGRFVITHRISGGKIPNLDFETRAEACRAAELLARCGDWRRSYPAIAGDDEMRPKAAQLIMDMTDKREAKHRSRRSRSLAGGTER